MPINSFKDDETHVEKNKRETLLRLFRYLLAYKKEIAGVLLVMIFVLVISLVNPLIMESAIDDYIAVSDYPGLFRLLGIALALNLLVILAVKVRMYVMAKVCNNILVTIRQELYTHIQTLDFHFLTAALPEKSFRGLSETLTR